MQNSKQISKNEELNYNPIFLVFLCSVQLLKHSLYFEAWIEGNTCLMNWYISVALCTSLGTRLEIELVGDA